MYLELSIDNRIRLSDELILPHCPFKASSIEVHGLTQIKPDTRRWIYETKVSTTLSLGARRSAETDTKV